MGINWNFLFYLIVIFFILSFINFLYILHKEEGFETWKNKKKLIVDTISIFISSLILSFIISFFAYIFFSIVNDISGIEYETISNKKLYNFDLKK